jgi:hypothetical protein
VKSSQELVTSNNQLPEIRAKLTVYGTTAEDDIAQKPGFDIAGGTGLKIVFEANGLPYSKVEVETGPFKGRLGWLSRASIDDPRTTMP